MPEWLAILVGALAVVFAQAVTAAYVYGKLAQSVASLTKESDRQHDRLKNVETVLHGDGGHAARITKLEAWRLTSPKND